MAETNSSPFYWGSTSAFYRSIQLHGLCFHTPDLVPPSTFVHFNQIICRDWRGLHSRSYAHHSGFPSVRAAGLNHPVLACCVIISMMAFIFISAQYFGSPAGIGDLPWMPAQMTRILSTCLPLDIPCIWQLSAVSLSASHWQRSGLVPN